MLLGFSFRLVLSTLCPLCFFVVNPLYKWLITRSAKSELEAPAFSP